MKKQKLLVTLTATILLTCSIILMESCQKTTVVKNSDQTEINDESKSMIEHINNFERKMEFHRDNPGLKSNEKQYVMQTVIDWESAVNMNYCYSYLDLLHAEVFDTIIDIPLEPGDSVLMANVSSKYYNEILLAVQAQYFAATFTDKKLMVVDLEPVNDGDKVRVRSLIGNTQAVVHPPFDWYWGEMEGVCITHQFQFTFDAAIKIAQNTRTHFREDPPEGQSWIFTNLESYTINDPKVTDDNGNYIYLNPDDDVEDDNYLDYLIYFADDDLADGLTEDVRCLEYDAELEFYKQSYINITQAWIDGSGGKKFKDCSYEGLEIEDEDEAEHILIHNLTFTIIGNRYLAEIAVPDDISNYSPY